MNKSRDEKILYIISKVGFGNTFYSELGSQYIKHAIFIGDILHYIDKNCFYYKVEEGIYRRDLEKLHSCVIQIYNIFIGNYRDGIDKLDDDKLDFIINIIQNETN